jgi:hypothetical protein
MIITAKLAASAVAVCAATAGLAVAGVTLPDPASDVAKSIGLPNQAEEKSGNAGGIEGAEDVRQNSEGDDVSTESHGESHGIGESVSGEAQQLGEAMREADTPEERKAIAEEFSNSVREQAQDRSRLPEEAQSAPQNGETNGETESQGGPETGEAHAEEGQSLGQAKADEHRSEDPGGNRP